MMTQTTFGERELPVHVAGSEPDSGEWSCRELTAHEVAELTPEDDE